MESDHSKVPVVILKEKISRKLVSLNWIEHPRPSDRVYDVTRFVSYFSLAANLPGLAPAVLDQYLVSNGWRKDIDGPYTKRWWLSSRHTIEYNMFSVCVCFRWNYE